MPVTAPFPRGLYALLHSGDVDAARAVLDGGASLVQLRMKHRSATEVAHAARALLPLCQEHQVPLIINDDPYVARDVGADGVHVGQQDMDVERVREIVGNKSLVGLSTHTEDQLRVACTKPALSYIAMGPIYWSSTKSGHADAVGPEELRRRVHWLRSFTQLPVVAIGGIVNEARAQAVARAGADAFAVAGAIDLVDLSARKDAVLRLSTAFQQARS